LNKITTFKLNLGTQIIKLNKNGQTNSMICDWLNGLLSIGKT